MKKPSLIFTIILSALGILLLALILSGWQKDRSEGPGKIAKTASRTPSFSVHGVMPNARAQAALPSPSVPKNQPVAMAGSSPSFPASVLGQGQVLDSRDTPPDAQGNFKREQLLQVDSKYPYWRVEAELQRDAASGEERLIKQTTEVADHVMVAIKTSSKPEQLTELLGRAGITIRRQIPNQPLYLLALPSASLDGVPDLLKKLKNEGALKYAEPDYVVTAYGTPNDTNFSELWGMNNTGQTGGAVDADIDAPEAWNQTTGSRSVVVGVIDTGIDRNHVDLAANIWTNPGEIPGNGIDDDGNGYVDDVYGWNFYGNNNNSLDDNNHGTHTAGTVGAVGNNGTGVSGVCWKVSLAALKFLSASGAGYDSDAAEAVYYANAKGITITSNSWGGGGFTQTLKDAIDAAGAKGYVFVAAAGNETTNTDSSANYPSGYDSDNVISVAATDSVDRISSFSNYGLKTVDLGAPGSDIYSTIPGNKYDSYSGTSMATPHVAGACALLKSANSDLSAKDLKSILMNSVDVIPGLKGKTVTGGRLNVYKALLTLNPLSVSPVAAWEPAGPQAGPFSPNTQSYTLTNRGTSLITWNASADQPWVTLSGVDGDLAAGASITVTASMNSAANQLPLGSAIAKLTFTTVTVGRSETRDVKLSVGPSLDLVLPAEVPEDAGTFQGQVTVNAAPATDLTVALSSADPAQVKVPATVILPAGKTSVSFTGTVLQDTLLNGTREVQLNASVAGYYSVQKPLTVTDDETTVISVSLPAQAAEGAGVLANAGRVTLANPAGTNVKVKLVSSDPSEIQVPATVTVLAGQTTATFDVTVIDDNRIDGTVLTAVTASVVHWTSGSASIAIADNEPHTLSVTLPAQVTEGVGPITGSVTASGVLVSPLDVTLTSAAPDRLSVPATVTIPAGASSISFEATAVENAVADGIKNVAVSAAAAAFTSGSASTAITDNDVHHFGFSTIASPQVKGVPFSVTITAYAADNSVSKYQGTASVSAFNGSLVSAVTATFVDGVWTGTAAADGPVKEIRLAADGGGAKGQSNAFDVGLSAVINIDPASLRETLYAGNHKTRFLTIHNDGDLNLDWSIALGNPASANAETSTVASVSPKFESESVTFSKTAHEPTTATPDLSTVYRTPSLTRISASGAAQTAAVTAPLPLETVFADLEKKSAQLTALIPNRYNFTEGVSGTSIVDGGGDLFDGGNYLSTDLGSFIPYTDGTLASSALLGKGGRYFTRKYDGLFVFAADVNALSYLQISGDLGADSKGNVDGAVLTVTRGKSTYYGFVKRVFNAGDPSVNHLIIVEGDGTQNHEFSTDTNNDYHRVTGLKGVLRVYYLLFSGSGGSYIDNTAALNLFNAFLDVSGASWLAVSPASGTLSPGASASVAVTLDAVRLDPGTYQKVINVTSNAPARPLVQVPVTLDVLPLIPLTVQAPAQLREGAGVQSGAGQVQLASNATEDTVIALASSNPARLQVPASVTIPAGSRAASFDLTPVDNQLLDGTENVTVSGSSADTTTGTAAVTVADNESATLNFSGLPASLSKSDADGHAVINASIAPTRDITITLGSSDPAELSVPASVVLPAGQTSVTFAYTLGDVSGQEEPKEITVTAAVDGWTGDSQVVSIAAAKATDAWTTFGNGPAHTGVYLGPLRGGVFKQDWAVLIPNALSGVLNQVAVADGKVWVTPQSYLGNFNHTLTALDARNGSQLWQYSFLNAYSINPPTYYRGKVYAQRCNHNTDTHLWSFDGTSGQVLWKTAHAARWDRYAAPTVTKDGIWVAGGFYGGLYGFNLDGTQRSFVTRAQYDGWTPTYSGGVVYSWLAGSFAAYDPVTGTANWSGTATVTPSWTTTVAPVSGHLAFLNGNRKLHAFDVNTHALAWSIDGVFTGTPAVWDGKLYVISGTQIKIFNAATGALIGTLETSDSALAGQPVVSTDTLIVSSATKTYLFDLDAGRLLQTLPYGGPVSVAGGSLYIAGSDGTLRAFRPVPVPVAEPEITPGSAHTLKWSAVPEATHYQVQYSTDAAFTAPVTSDWTAATSHTVTGLADATRYYYRVRAHRVTGTVTAWESPWSDVVNSRQLADSDTDGLADDWELQTYGTLAHGASDVDPRHGGVPNLLAFALNLPSTGASSTGGLPAISTREVNNRRYLALEYTPNPAASKLLYQVEVSSDLTTWHSGTEHTVIEVSGSNVLVRDIQPLDAQPRRFIRLRVSAP